MPIHLSSTDIVLRLGLTVLAGLVIGLCLGGGQIGLGTVTTAIGFVTLWALAPLEGLLRQDRRAQVAIDVAADGPSDGELRRRLSEAGLAIIDELADLPGIERVRWHE